MLMKLWSKMICRGYQACVAKFLKKRSTLNFNRKFIVGTLTRKIHVVGTIARAILHKTVKALKHNFKVPFGVISRILKWKQFWFRHVLWNESRVASFRQEKMSKVWTNSEKGKQNELSTQRVLKWQFNSISNKVTKPLEKYSAVDIVNGWRVSGLAQE